MLQGMMGVLGVRQGIWGELHRGWRGRGLDRIILGRIYSKSGMCFYQQPNRRYRQKTIRIPKLV